nr:MAG TPA: hypothetical protein [Caudoviricetes sp.]
MYTVEVEKQINDKKIINTAEFSSYKMADEYVDMLSSDEKIKFKYGKDEIPRYLKPQKYNYGSKVVSISKLGRSLTHISLSKEYPEPDAELVYVKEDLRNDSDNYIMIHNANIPHDSPDSDHYLVEEHIHEYTLIASAGDDNYALIGYTTPIFDTNDPITYKILTGIPYYNFDNTLVLSYEMNEVHHYIVADTVASLIDYIFIMDRFPSVGASLYWARKYDDRIYVSRLNNARIITKNSTSTVYIDGEIRIRD